MWTVEPITKKQADFIITRRHYSRLAPSFWAGFALVDNDGLIEGVVVFGSPPVPLMKHAFIERDFQLYELTRLVIQTAKPNAASFLVGRALKMLPSPCAIVSYADTEWGHSGIVYQATNWIYTGAARAKDNTYLIDGRRVHPRTLASRGITNPKGWAKENGVESVPASVKHRYFFVSGNAKQKKKIIAGLRYPTQPYPKSEKRMYDAGDHVLLSVLDRDADGFGGLV